MLGPAEQWTLHGYYEFTKSLTERVPPSHPNTVPAPISAVSSALGCRVRHRFRHTLVTRHLDPQGTSIATGLDAHSGRN